MVAYSVAWSITNKLRLGLFLRMSGCPLIEFFWLCADDQGVLHKLGGRTGGLPFAQVILI